MKKLLLLTLFLIQFLGLQALDYQVLKTVVSTAYTSYYVNYTSVGADAKTPTTLSGVVTVPNYTSLANLDVLVLDCHHTVCDDASAPSSLGSTLAGSLALGGVYPMVCPDYLGYGLTKDQVHPFLCQELLARQSLDLVVVAIDLLADEKIGIHPHMLGNIGYSQGGGVAMGVHKLYENDADFAGLADTFTLGIHTVCGDGPYDPLTTGYDFYAKAERVTFPALLPLLINGFLCGADDNLKAGVKFNDFFQEHMLTPSKITNPMTGNTEDYPGLEALIASKLFNNDQASMMMVLANRGSWALADFFSADMMDKESALYKNFFAWLTANSVCRGWTPKSDITLYHLIEDDVVTSENAVVAFSELNIPTDRQHLISASSIGIKNDNTHSQFATPFFIGAVKELATAYNSATGLDAIESVSSDAPAYDLMGRQVGAGKGFMVKGGRVILVK